MAKNKDTKKSAAAANPELEAEVKQLRQENEDLRKRLDKIAAIAEDMPEGEDDLEEDEDDEDGELMDDEDLEDADEEEEEEEVTPARRA